MEYKKVKVFDVYKMEPEDIEYYKTNFNINDYDRFDFHNQIVKNNKVYSKYSKNKSIIPLEQHLEEKTKYELSENERLVLKMFKDDVKKAKHFLDSAERKLSKYEHILVNSIEDLHDADLYQGDEWECELSPIGRCIYKLDEYGNEYECVFCGEPEERK